MWDSFGVADTQQKKSNKREMLKRLMTSFIINL